MIEKMNHFSFTTPASIHDEEALTALELAGRTGSKMNEVIDEVNKFTESTTKTINEHQTVINGVPGLVETEVNKLKEVGTFDEAINNRLKQSFYGQVSVGAKITLTQDGTATAGGLLVKFPNRLSMWYNAGTTGGMVGGTKEWTDITATLTNYYVYDEVKCDIEVEYGCGLYYDVVQEKLIMCPPQYAYINMICLLVNRYGRAVDGQLYHEYLSYCEDEIESAQKSITSNYNTYKIMEYGFVYAGNENDVKITSGESGALTVVLPESLIFIAPPSYNGTSINVREAVTEISSYTTLTDDKITVNIPYRTALLYNYNTGKFVVAPIAYVYPGLVLLINNIYSNAVNGCLIDEINAKHKKLNTVVRNYESDDKLDNFAQVVASASENSENLLFFTDSHTAYGEEWESRTSAHIEYIKRLYASSPCDLIIDGGDWLTDSMSGPEATRALGFIKNQWAGYPHYMVLGNHDTNYQGVTRLTQATINKAAFGGKSYYTLETDKSLFVFLDSQTDNATLNDTSYKVEQIAFLKDALLSNTKEHIIIVMHIFYSPNETKANVVFDLGSDVNTMVYKFNGKASYTDPLLNESVDFTGATGRVEVIIAGHMHSDFVGSSVVPYFITKNNDFTAKAIDLINIDYDNKIIKAVRVGNGSDRTLALKA